MPTKTTWSYKNYLKPTPDNIQYLVTALKTILLAVSGTVLANGNPVMAFWIMVGGAVLDELSKFFARVAHDINLPDPPA